MEVSVDNGCFIPHREGNYTIEYRAEDTSGNYVTKCVNVKALKGEGLQVALRDTVTEMSTGTSGKVFSAMEYTDASGNVSYSVKAKHLETQQEVEINTQSLSFTPMMSSIFFQ